MLNNTKTQSCFLESRAQIVTEQKHCNQVVHQKGLFPVSVNKQLMHNSLIQSISQSRKSTSQDPAKYKLRRFVTEVRSSIDITEKH